MICQTPLVLYFLGKVFQKYLIFRNDKNLPCPDLIGNYPLVFAILFSISHFISASTYKALLSISVTWKGSANQLSFTCI